MGTEIDVNRMSNLVTSIRTFTILRYSIVLEPSAAGELIKIFTRLDCFIHAFQKIVSLADITWDQFFRKTFTHAHKPALIHDGVEHNFWFTAAISIKKRIKFECLFYLIQDDVVILLFASIRLLLRSTARKVAKTIVATTKVLMVRLSIMNDFVGGHENILESLEEVEQIKRSSVFVVHIHQEKFICIKYSSSISWSLHTVLSHSRTSFRLTLIAKTNQSA